MFLETLSDKKKNKNVNTFEKKDLNCNAKIHTMTHSDSQKHHGINVLNMKGEKRYKQINVPIETRKQKCSFLSFPFGAAQYTRQSR
jgi:hypothetical protein